MDLPFAKNTAQTHIWYARFSWRSNIAFIATLVIFACHTVALAQTDQREQRNERTAQPGDSVHFAKSTDCALCHSFSNAAGAMRDGVNRTLDKIYAITLLKLIGAPNRVILWMIMQQALLLGGLGYLVAYTAGMQLFPKFPRRVVLTSEDLIQLAIVVFIISILSSLMGIWKALKVEPNEVLMS